MAPKPPPPSPERDRLLASRPRLGPRRAVSVGEVVRWVMGDAEMQRRRRFLRVTDALKAAIDAKHLNRIKPIRFAGGLLTIEVVDGPLLAEMKQHVEPRLLTALAQAGTGVERIRWTLARGWR